MTALPRPAADPLTKAAGENFVVVPSAGPSALRRHLSAVYRFARYVDDLGDESARPREPRLRAVAGDVLRLYDGQSVADPIVAGIGPTVRECEVPQHTWLRLIEANVQDQHVTRYAGFDDLLGYCELSANPVGEIVLHLLGRATADRITLSDRICTGLQLLEHWQDVREDAEQDRIYLPQEDLRRYGVAESELTGPVAGDALRALLEFQTDRALAWLNAGAYLVPTLRGWGRWAVSGYVAGGRAAATALRRSGFDPLTRTPKPSRTDIAAAWLAASVRRPG